MVLNETRLPAEGLLRPFYYRMHTAKRPEQAMKWAQRSFNLVVFFVGSFGLHRSRVLII